MNGQNQSKKIIINKKNKIIPIKFDKEGFFLFLGIGLLSFGSGLLIVWGISTAPEGKTGSTAFTLYQRIARLVPESIQEKVALALGVLFMLFGLVLFLGVIKLTLQFIVKLLKSRTK